LAVRLVQGSVPTSTPLQPAPVDAHPNYQGNIEFKATESTQEFDKPNKNPQDEFKDLKDIDQPQSSQTRINSGNGKWQFAIILALGLGLLYGYFRFKKTMR
jgi:hypothetical protein